MRVYAGTFFGDLGGDGIILKLALKWIMGL
jgi:hypothetical protein